MSSCTYKTITLTSPNLQHALLVKYIEVPESFRVLLPLILLPPVTGALELEEAMLPVAALSAIVTHERIS